MPLNKETKANLGDLISVRNLFKSVMYLLE